MIVAIDPEMGKDGWSKIRDIKFRNSYISHWIYPGHLSEGYGNKHVSYLILIYYGMLKRRSQPQ